MTDEKRWWYSLTRHTVEDDDGPTPGKDRLGPFPTEEAASRLMSAAPGLTSAAPGNDVRAG
jgi:hypothetical protein